MKLIFLGSGSAFTIGANNFQSNMLLENEKKERLLIDCGSDARFALYELGLTYKDINQVYISHLHADHAGGLEWLAFCRKFDKSCERPVLYISENLPHVLWNKVLAGGLSSLQGVEADLSTYFQIQSIPNNGEFTWNGLNIKIIQTVHVISGFMIVPSYGLIFSADNKTVFLTTDTQFTPHQLADFYKMADVIFQDCETGNPKSEVHAHYDELKTLDPSIKKKMWLYHYNPGSLPDARKEGFRGFVKKGQCFDFANPETY